ncbi:MAG: hypothetical protein U1D55_07405 [Phycisphaerae bacterium]
MSAKFSMGRTYMTPAAMAELDPRDVTEGLRRHAAGDWGDCGPEDAAENDFAVSRDLRLFSVYRDRNDTKFWVITEADRSATTVLLPDDY